MHYALHACPECGERCYCQMGEDAPEQCAHVCEADAPERDFSDDEAQYNYED